MRTLTVFAREETPAGFRQLEIAVFPGRRCPGLEVNTFGVQRTNKLRPRQSHRLTSSGKAVLKNFLEIQRTCELSTRTRRLRIEKVPCDNRRATK